MATALVTQIAYAVQTLFDPAGTAGRLVDLGKLANYGLLTSFTPAALFTTGVNGAWYDPSDFSTLFQDAAGTVPVTAVGQPVGLMKDKSGRGNHAFNPSGNSANFPVLSARYNLLTKTEDFSGAVWFRTAGASATANSITLASAGDFVYSATTVTFPAGAAYTWSVQVNSSQRLITFGGATPAGTDTYSQVYMGGGVYRQMLTRAFTASGTASIQTMLGANQPAGSGTFNVSQADLRVANDALNQPTYQRVNTATDYDTVGFKPYLSFNGVNQGLQTNNIDFTYGDKMFVSAGVRKLSDAATGMLVELGAIAPSGRFYIAAPYPASSVYGFNAKGTTDAEYAATGYSAPVTNILSSSYSLQGTLAQNIIPRVNGVSPVLSITAAGPAGGGNYGNYPLYIGARGGSSLWFNGRLYGLVVAGKAASANEIASTEAYLNQKTGAY